VKLSEALDAALEALTARHALLDSYLAALTPVV